MEIIKNVHEFFLLKYATMNSTQNCCLLLICDNNIVLS
jgi:hypothetical protein